MERLCFKKSCEKIENVVDEKDFKSEVFLETLTTSHVHTKLKESYNVHVRSTGGFVSGDIMLAITLRLLA